MSYDFPKRVRYGFASAGWGNSAAQKQFIGPPGKKGRVVDIELASISADFVGTTTVPEVGVGLTAGTNEYARFRAGTTAILGYTTASQKARRARTEAKGQITLTDFAGHVELEKALIPADTPFMISLVAGTGGSPAGTSEVHVEVEWD